MNQLHESSLDGNRAASERKLTSEELSVLKREINTLIWMFAPQEMSLGKADEIACRFFEEIVCS